MTRNLFIVNTEYHLLISIYIIETFYPKETSENHILITKSIKRFKNSLNLKDYKTYILNVNYDFKQLDKIFIKKEVLEIINNIGQVNTLHVFLDTNYLNLFLLSHYKRKFGTKCILVQEGMSSYLITYKPIKFIFSYVKYLVFSTLNGFQRNTFNKTWGFNKNIDEIWLSNPESFHNKGNKKLKELNFLFTKKNINKLYSIFYIEKIPNIDFRNNDIVYFSQPVKLKSFKSNQEFFLKYLQEECNKNDIKLFIKLHPTENKSHFLKIHSFLNNTQLIDQNIPAEIFIASFKNLILISPYSASFIFKNNDCKYYWIYPLLKMEIDIKISFSHVKILKSKKEICTIFSEITPI